MGPYVWVPIEHIEFFLQILSLVHQPIDNDTICAYHFDDEDDLPKYP